MLQVERACVVQRLAREPRPGEVGEPLQLAGPLDLLPARCATLPVLYHRLSSHLGAHLNCKLLPM